MNEGPRRPGIGEHDFELGRLLALSRRRSASRTGGPAGGLVEKAMAAFLIVMMTLCASGGIIMALERLEWIDEKPNPPLALGVMAAVMTTLTGGWVLLARRDARYVVLAVHDRGFRFRGKSFAFGDIAAIHFGRSPSGLERVLGPVNSFFGQFKAVNRRVAEDVVRFQQTSLRIVSRSGDEHILNGFLEIVEPEVARVYFDRIHALRPELIRADVD